MTTREFYTSIAALDNEELAAFATAEIAKMDAANEKRKAKNAEKKAELAPILDKIYDEVLTEDPITASDVHAQLAADFEELKVQRVSSWLRALVTEGRAVQTEVSVKGKGKAKAYAKI